MLQARNLVFTEVGDTDFKQFCRDLDDLDDDQIQAGVHESKYYKGGPLKTGQFWDWCIRAQLVGYPPVDKAFKEALDNAHRYGRHNWSHDVIHRAVIDTTVMELRQSGKSDKLKRAFEVNYSRACQKHRRGEDLNLPSAVIEKRPEFLDQEEGLSRAAQLRKEMGF